MAALLFLTLLSVLPIRVLGGDMLSSNGFAMCQQNSSLNVKTLDVQYDRSTRVLTFDVAGSSSESQNVTALLTVTAYGRQVYQNSFSPCDVNMTQMCPDMSSTVDYNHVPIGE